MKSFDPFYSARSLKASDPFAMPSNCCRNSMRDRWTERDRQLKATLTEKIAQTPPSTPESMPRGDSTTTSSSTASQVGPLSSLSDSGDPTAGAAAAGVKGGGGSKFYSPGLRATRETSMSYY